MRIARVWLCGGLWAIGAAQGGEAVALRGEHFPVLPSHLAVTHVLVQNLQSTPFSGEVVVQGPAGWRIAQPAGPVQLAPGETKRVPLSIQRAQESADNSYLLEIIARSGTQQTVRKQRVMCASAPYFKPTIDGKIDDWKDAIPVTFVTRGRKTVVSSYWNRTYLALLVAVEEDRLVGYRPGVDACDALQVAVAAKDTPTGKSADMPATRYEYLFVAGDGGPGKCFRLAEPGMPLVQTQQIRNLEGLEYDQAQLVAWRRSGVTYYECAIPWRPLRDSIRPSEGREFCLSFLVHDPDGTGLRDWGVAAGLWPTQRNRLAWSQWSGAKWGAEPPMDNKIEWGLCASKY